MGCLRQADLLSLSLFGVSSLPQTHLIISKVSSRRQSVRVPDREVRETCVTSAASVYTCWEMGLGARPLRCHREGMCFLLRTPPCPELAVTSRGGCITMAMEGEVPRLPALPPPRDSQTGTPGSLVRVPWPACDSGEGLLASLLRRVTFGRRCLRFSRCERGF